MTTQFFDPFATCSEKRHILLREFNLVLKIKINVMISIISPADFYVSVFVRGNN